MANKYRRKYYKQLKKDQSKNSIFKFRSYIFFFILFLIISFTCTIHYISKGPVVYLQANATIIKLDDWDVSKTVTKRSSTQTYTYQYLCKFIDNNGKQRKGIYKDTDTFGYFKNVSYQDGLKYENGDVVSIYYSKDFKDGENVYSSNIDYHFIMICISWGITALYLFLILSNNK